MEAERKEYLDLGIHVMAAQNGKGDITIGDSHEYGLSFDPFDHATINQLILDYLKTFLHIDGATVTESWHGIYPKRTNGEIDFIHSPEQGVTIVNGLGGNGMTLSFGLAEEVVATI